MGIVFKHGYRSFLSSFPTYLTNTINPSPDPLLATAPNFLQLKQKSREESLHSIPEAKMANLSKQLQQIITKT